MSGRFFSAPFFLSLCILSQTSRLPQKRISRIVLALGIVALGSLTPHIPLLTNADFGTAHSKIFLSATESPMSALSITPLQAS
jgi:hypothetical protein